MIDYKASAFTDIGTVKKVNQDSLTVQIAENNNQKILMAVLCDGMGGYSCGELTSASLIYAFSQWFGMELPVYIKENHEINCDYVKSAWSDIITQQNKKIISYSKSKNIITGTTVTGILIYDDLSYVIINIGDSRVYFIGEDIQQMTVDHSAVNFFTEEEMKKNHYSLNALVKCVGIYENAVPDFFTGKLKNSTNILLCSDGFRNKLSDDEIYQLFNIHDCFAEGVIKNNIISAIETVKARGERDNISAAVISF